MSIVQNKKAFHDYFIEERFEAGLVLEGWEVKAIRAGRAQLKEAYVVVKSGELFLIGAHVSPLASTSTHVHADPTRTRKLLFHSSEIAKLVGKVERAGYTLVPLDLHYTRGRIKLSVGLAKGISNTISVRSRKIKSGRENNSVSSNRRSEAPYSDA